MPKVRRCRQCKLEYLPERTGQRVCSIKCGVADGREQQRKARERAHRERKRRLREEDWSFRTKQAQKAFNAYIRLRDEMQNLPCVSCGRYHQGQYHAGHYRTTKAQPALRFNEINCHRQCSACNNHLSGAITEYRIELIRRLGIDLVEWLEKDHPKTKRWSVEELRAIEQYYKDAVKAMMETPGVAEPF